MSDEFDPPRGVSPWVLGPVPVRLTQTPPSLPGLTPKSGVPDFGAFRVTKVGNIRLWLLSIFFAKMMDPRVKPAGDTQAGSYSRVASCPWPSLLERWPNTPIADHPE